MKVNTGCASHAVAHPNTDRKMHKDSAFIVGLLASILLLTSFHIQPANAVIDCGVGANVNIVCYSRDFCADWIMGEYWFWQYYCLEHPESGYQRCTIAHRQDNHYHAGNWCAHKTVCEHHNRPCSITWDRCWETCWDMIWNRQAPGCFPVGWNMETDCHYTIISCVC